MCSEDRMVALEKLIAEQQRELKKMGDRSHEFDIELTKVTEALKNVSQLDHRLTETTRGIYKRFDTLDGELKDSFEKRDQKIVDLQIDNAKVNTRQLIYASVSFTVITIMVQIGKGLL